MCYAGDLNMVDYRLRSRPKTNPPLSLSRLDSTSLRKPWRRTGHVEGSLVHLVRLVPHARREGARPASTTTPRHERGCHSASGQFAPSPHVHMDYCGSRLLLQHHELPLSGTGGTPPTHPPGERVPAIGSRDGEVGVPALILQGHRVPVRSRHSVKPVRWDVMTWQCGLTDHEMAVSVL